MTPSDHRDQSDYARIAAAIRYLDEALPRHPTLDEVAAHVDLSPAHFQRLFTRWAGVSPKRFLQAATLERAKAALAGARNLCEASWDSGLSGSGRLHDLFVATEAVTPGEWRTRGAGLALRAGVHPTPFGDALVALSPRGICSLHFAGDEGTKALWQTLATRWSGATITEDADATRDVMARLFAAPANGATQAGANSPLALHLRGTNFQLQVWRALLAIPDGAVATYAQVAAAIGTPRATRAVGTAIGANPVAWLIPCHRVLRGTGALGGYRWGVERKRVMLAWEESRRAG